MGELSTAEREAIESASNEPMLRQVEAWAAINTGTANLDGLKTMAGLLADEFARLPGELKLGDAAPADAIDPDGSARQVRYGQNIHLAVRPQAPVQLLSVASLVPRKGHALLLDALHRLRDLPWQLTCVGSLDLDPPTAQAIRAAAHERGLDARISFVGAVPSADLARFYDAADVFVMPTLYEGYGLAVAEAVARGLPVIATRTGGIPDLVDEHSGVIVPPGAVDPLTTALDRVIRDDAWRSRLAAGAWARAATLPTWPETGAAVERALLAAETRGKLQR